MNKTNKNNEVLRFINLYRSHEVLWNMNISLYRRNDLKIKAYESISVDMKMSVEDVKKKIKSLRTAYSAEKTKVEKSKKSGCDADSMYIPKVFWYNEMTFLNPSLIRRATVDNSNQEDIDTLLETSLDSELNELSFSESSCNEARIVTPTCSKKRKHSPEPKSKLDDALDKLIGMNKDASVFEIFGENVGRQIKEFPEEDAYQLMADIQVILSKRKMDLLRKDRMAKSKIVSVEVLKPLRNFQSIASTSLSPGSNSNYSSDVLDSAMLDADILEEDCL